MKKMYVPFSRIPICWLLIDLSGILLHTIANGEKYIYPSTVAWEYVWHECVATVSMTSG